jgi:hypothetical protein
MGLASTTSTEEDVMTLTSTKINDASRASGIASELHRAVDMASLAVSPLLPTSHRIESFSVRRSADGKLSVEYSAKLEFNEHGDLVGPQSEALPNR